MSKSDLGGDETDHGEPGSDVRCGCGSLLARLICGGVELKCRRCRRCVVLTFDADGRVAVDGKVLGLPTTGPANTNKEPA